MFGLPDHPSWSTRIPGPSFERACTPTCLLCPLVLHLAGQTRGKTEQLCSHALFAMFNRTDPNAFGTQSTGLL